MKKILLAALVILLSNIGVVEATSFWGSLITVADGVTVNVIVAAINTSGDAIVVWQTSGGAIQSSTRAFDSTVWSEPLTAATGVGTLGGLDVALDDSRNAYVIWADQTHGLVAANILPSGGVWQTKQTLGTGTVSSMLSQVGITLDSNQIPVAAFILGSNISVAAYMGSWMTTALATGSVYGYPCDIVSSSGGDLLAVWNTGAPGSNAKLEFSTRMGGVWSSPQMVSALNSSLAFDIAAGGSDRFIIEGGSYNGGTSFSILGWEATNPTLTADWHPTNLASYNAPTSSSIRNFASSMNPAGAGVSLFTTSFTASTTLSGVYWPPGSTTPAASQTIDTGIIPYIASTINSNNLAVGLWTKSSPASIQYSTSDTGGAWAAGQSVGSDGYTTFTQPVLIASNGTTGQSVDSNVYAAINQPALVGSSEIDIIYAIWFESDGATNRIVSLRHSTPPSSPSSPSGTVLTNRFATQRSSQDVLNWSAPLSGLPIARYEVYLDALLTNPLLTTTSTTYTTQAINPYVARTYYVVAIDIDGNVSEPAVIYIQAFTSK